jgi:hypothetical protein
MPDPSEAPKPPRISTLPLLVITIAGFAASVASCNYLNQSFATPLPALAVAIGWNIGTVLGFAGLLSLTFTGWRGFGAPPRPGAGSPTPNQALILAGSGVLLALSGCGYFAGALERSPPVSIAGAVLFFGGLLLAGGGLVVAVLRARRK